MAPDRTDRIARDLGGALADAKLPAPYIIVAPVDLEPIVVRLAGPAAPAGPVSGPANSGLLMIPQQQPMTGWIITPAGDRREVKLGTIDHIVVQIRSLVWPLKGAQGVGVQRRLRPRVYTASQTFDRDDGETILKGTARAPWTCRRLMAR